MTITKKGAAAAVKVIERGKLAGKLYALYESTSGSAVNARIRPADGGNAVICTADQSKGTALREVLFEAVQVHGMGTWTRSPGGAWVCEAMAIETVRRVQNVTLRQAIDQLRALEVEWPEDPIIQADGGQCSGSQFGISVGWQSSLGLVGHNGSPFGSPKG